MLMNITLRDPSAPQRPGHRGDVDTLTLNRRQCERQSGNPFKVDPVPTAEEDHPTTTKDGKPGKAKYELAQEVADGSKDRAAKPLDLRPLYPGFEI